MEDCIFCNLEPSRIEDRNEFFVAIKDLYPVTEGHTLIILNDHNKSYFDLRDVDIIRLNQIIRFQKDELIEKDNSISGLNIGINQGKDAGQTVMHLHIHLIPRRKGDVEDPKGGVRGVIPVKQNYSKD